jgi:signal transduction histidine kinase
LHPGAVFTVFAVVFTLLVTSILVVPIFPDCYLEGVGLTPFKKNAEYVIIFFLVLSGILLIRKKEVFDGKVLSFLLLAIAASIVSELAFTFYVGTYDQWNIAGHLLKIVAFYFIYAAILKTGIRDPFELIFKELKQSRENLQVAKQELETQVAERSIELLEVNMQLQNELAERKSAENTLRLSEERYRSIFNSSGVSLWEEDFSGVREMLDALQERGVTDVAEYIRNHPEFLVEAAQKVQVLDVNDATVEIFRAGSKAELLGPLDKIFNSASYKVFGDELMAIAQGSGRLEWQTVNCRRDGEQFDALITLNIPDIWTKDGRLIVSVADITNLKQAEKVLQEHRFLLETKVRGRTRDLEERTQELARTQQSLQFLLEDVNEAKEELRAANKKLQELDHLKSMFIASMSHELRTPLNSIIGFTGILLQGLAGPLNEEQRKQLGMVKGSSQHLLQLITDIIDLSKIEAGKISLSIDFFDLAKIAREVMETFRVAAGRKSLQLEVLAPESLLIRSDIGRIRQVLVNLMGNAVKFTDKGKVSVQVREENGLALVAVEDSGPGIRQEDLGQLFRYFSQITSPDLPKHEGTGLGLYLSKKLMNLLGGDIRVDSEFGQGSIFTLTLPIIEKGEQ